MEVMGTAVCMCINSCVSASTYPQLYNAGHYGRVPAVLDAQQLLAGLDAQISRLVAGALQQEAMLSTVHGLRFLDDAKHGLIYLIDHQSLADASHVQLQHRRISHIKLRMPEIYEPK